RRSCPARQRHSAVDTRSGIDPADRDSRLTLPAARAGGMRRPRSAHACASPLPGAAVADGYLGRAAAIVAAGAGATLEPVPPLPIHAPEQPSRRCEPV